MASSFLNCFKSEITINSKHVEAYNNNNTTQGSCSTLKKQFLFMPGCTYYMLVYTVPNYFQNVSLYVVGTTTLKIFSFLD